ncbi:MAG: SAM-dependent methyltransferase [Opitutales bacterium]
MSNSSDVVEQAREYYDSGDADNFYFHVWGGEDIHIGLYESETEPVAQASRRTVNYMAEKLARWPAGTRVLDIGAGYGGSARFLAREKGYHLTCLNLSVVQNERNRAFNTEQGLADQVEVVDGSFEDLPFDNAAYDIVWSQDSLLHSGQRETVFGEVNRVLKPGGEFIFTDPMQRENVDPQILEPVLARIHLASMGSIDTYQAYAKDLGWETREIEDLSHQLPRHYSRVKAVLTEREQELSKFCSDDYRTRMKQGLNHWIKAGQADALAWAILHFRKP